MSVDTVRSLCASQRHYCAQCGLLLMQKDLPTHEQQHRVVHHITDAQLETPTTLITPIDDKKSQAVRNKGQCSALWFTCGFVVVVVFAQQFFFSDESLQFLSSALKGLQYKGVLCIGTPR